MADDRPAWARRMYNERQARGWSQADAIRAMRAHSAKELPGTSSLLRQYKRWEAGEVTPREFYQPIIAQTFGTVTHAMFPVAPKRDADADVLAVTGMDTLELVSRLQRSDLDQATLDGLRIMADRLCSEYPFMPPDQLLTEGRAWLQWRASRSFVMRRAHAGRSSVIGVHSLPDRLSFECRRPEGGDTHGDTQVSQSCPRLPPALSLVVLVPLQQSCSVANSGHTSKSPHERAAMERKW